MADVHQLHDRAVAERTRTILPTCMGQVQVNIADAKESAKKISMDDRVFFTAEVLAAVAGTIVAAIALSNTPGVETGATLVVSFFAIVKAAPKKSKKSKKLI